MTLRKALSARPVSPVCQLSKHIGRRAARQAGAVILAFTLLFASCRKPSGANWDVDLVIPVASSKLNISNFIADTIFEADQGGLLHFRFNRELVSLKLDTLVELPTTSIDTSFLSPIDYPLTPGQPLTFFTPTELTFTVSNGVEITTADLRAGKLIVDFGNNSTQPLDFVYKVPSATKDGQPLVISETVPPGMHSLKREYDLSGYRLSMRGQNGNKYNTIVQAYTLALNANAQPITVHAQEGVFLNISYTKIIPEYIEGWFGDDVIEIKPDTASFSFLGNVKAKNFLLSQARMEFRILNAFGADFEASLFGIRSINMQTGQSVLLNTDKLSSLHFDWPKRNWNTVTSSTRTVVFDQNNSNITAFISNLPDRIAYQGSVQINPPPVGQAIGHTNFAFYDKGIQVLADIDIPIRFTADEIAVESVAKVDFGNVEQLDHVNQGRFVVSGTNGYPFTAKLQAYMLDEAGVTIDSLFIHDANFMEHGMLDQNNVVTQPTFTRIYIPFDEDKIANLKKCRSMRIVSRFLMPPNPPDIQILEKYEFDIKIVAELSYNVGIK